MKFKHTGMISAALAAILIGTACVQTAQMASAEDAHVEPIGLHTVAGKGEVFMGGPGGNLKIEILVPPEATNGAFDVIQETHFEGFAPPVHHHPTASETFYVVKGRYTWTVGDDTFDVGPGDTVHIPANTSHTMISHDEGIVNMTYMPSGLIQRLRMSKAFESELSDPEFRAKLTALTGHINGRPGEPVQAGQNGGMGAPMADPH